MLSPIDLLTVLILCFFITLQLLYDQEDQTDCTVK